MTTAIVPVFLGCCYFQPFLSFFRAASYCGSYQHPAVPQCILPRALYSCWLWGCWILLHFLHHCPYLRFGFFLLKNQSWCHLRAAALISVQVFAAWSSCSQVTSAPSCEVLSSHCPAPGLAGNFGALILQKGRFKGTVHTKPLPLTQMGCRRYARS